MSRLDSFIRRVSAQRDCLNHAAPMIAGLPGPVLELGLGNGRTYDHLRELFPDREIFVFERHLAAHIACVPAAAARFGRTAALAHCDMGTGEKASTEALAAFIGPAVDALMAPGGIVVSDQPYRVAGWKAVALPDGVAPGRYFISRVGG